MNIFKLLLYILSLGIGATLIMDIWLFILKKLNIPTLNFAFLGRWVGWIFRGKIIHASIARSPVICAELAGDFHLGYARQLTDKSSLLFDLAF